jgi:hypothetical protein
LLLKVIDRQSREFVTAKSASQEDGKQSPISCAFDPVAIRTKVEPKARAEGAFRSHA